MIARLGLLAGILTATSWGVMFPILASLLTKMDPYWLTSIRYIGASSVLALILLAVEGPRAFRLDSRWPLLAIIGSLAIAGFNLFVLTGIKLSGAEHAALMVAMGPAFVAIITWLRTRQAPRPIILVTIVAAFVGVALVVTKGNVASVLHGGSIVGDLELAAGVLCFTIYTAFATSFGDWSWLRFTTLSVSFGGIATILATLVATAFGVAHVPGLDLGPAFVWGMLYMILVAAVLAFIMWNFAIQAAGSQNTVLFMNLVPVVAFVVALLSGHHFSAIEYAGAILTILALVVSNVASRKAALPVVLQAKRAA